MNDKNLQVLTNRYSIMCSQALDYANTIQFHSEASGVHFHTEPEKAIDPIVFFGAQERLERAMDCLNCINDLLNTLKTSSRMLGATAYGSSFHAQAVAETARTIWSVTSLQKKALDHVNKMASDLAESVGRIKVTESVRKTS